jgi:hypothetical protein
MREDEIVKNGVASTILRHCQVQNMFYDTLFCNVDNLIHVQMHSDTAHRQTYDCVFAL